MTTEEMAQVLDVMASELKEKSELAYGCGRTGHSEVYTSRADACEAGAAALRAGEWKPIKDAPKDGMPVLIMNDRGIHVAQFETEKTHGDAHMPWWYVNDGKSNLRAIRGSEPTHFRELPAPPEGV